MTRPAARNSDPETSYESAQQIDALAAKLRGLIKNLARKAGYNGLSISEAATSIPEHKPWSISPRFAELIRSGDSGARATRHQQERTPDLPETPRQSNRAHRDY